MMQSVLFATTFMAALGGLLALFLALASKRLYVFEDPRIDQVEELLPHSNCGACGTAGCRNFAEQVVAGSIEPARCTVNPPQQNQSIASLLGIDLGNVEKRIARLACAGGNNVAKSSANYVGHSTCRSAAVISGGGRSCVWGCLGLGDCSHVCDFGAIHMNRQGLPEVDPAKCTACGDCVDICPKQLFSLEPVSRQLWVACKNQADPSASENSCEVSCTACGRCVMDAAPGLIKLDRNLAVIDYSKNDMADRRAIERCPTGAIVWLDGQRADKGRAARKIIRIQPLPATAEA
ncbi:RnfABCDGE type electron transport complex subunit B [Sideroxyarcus sp. TK5]|jgi:Na+-translocating ferredoxin:NAD+ oxidoreductase RNF subunit RnfB